MNIFNYLFNTINGDFMSLSDIMSKNIIVGSVDDGIYEIASIMKENDIGFVPIARDDKIVGVITDRDIVVKIISNHDYNSNITNYMTKDIVDVSIGSSLNDVLSIMKKYKVKRVLVTDGDRVLGVVSLSDILNCNLDDEVLSCIKDIFEVGPNIHKYESEIDEFYL